MTVCISRGRENTDVRAALVERLEKEKEKIEEVKKTKKKKKRAKINLDAQEKEVKKKRTIIRRLVIWINGAKKEFGGSEMSKAFLVVNPHEYMIPVTHEKIMVGFDLDKDQLLVKFEGIISNNFPPVVKKNRVRCQKIENTPVGQLR